VTGADSFPNAKQRRGLEVSSHSVPRQDVRSSDGKVVRKGLGKLIADHELREWNADRAKPKRGVKELQSRGGELNSMSWSPR